MDIPGLTRMQVASHLQKCRNNNWQTPEERRSAHTFRDMISSQYKPRKFGSMPQLDRAHAYPQSAQISRMQPGNEIQNSFGNVGYVPSTMTNDFFLFQDPVCPIRNFSITVPQGSRAPKQTSIPVPSPCLRDQAYPGQNSAVASVDSSSMGQWSASETSNVESDVPETKANIKSE
ncbi:uncharacterized protein LOC142504620 [Primulina tabacum]|uniref:uncharacterized protein LOC142504620 n=1 Tax=Primulina tabacum TaxID=48773 RepID=UPI003F59A8AE